MVIVTFILSAIWNFVLSKLGMSPDRKLGNLEVENKDQAAALKEKTYEAKVFSAPGRSVDDVNAELLRHAERGPD